MADSKQKPKSVRLLLFAVISMGVLLLAGLMLVIGTILLRARAPDSSGTAARGAAFVHRLQIPADMEVASITPMQRRIIVHLRPRNINGADLLLYLDATTGEELGRVRLAPAPDAAR